MDRLDNLPVSLKSTIDSIAELLGEDDSSPRIAWGFSQVRHSVRQVVPPMKRKKGEGLWRYESYLVVQIRSAPWLAHACELCAAAQQKPRKAKRRKLVVNIVRSLDSKEAKDLLAEGNESGKEKWQQHAAASSPQRERAREAGEDVAPNGAALSHQPSERPGPGDSSAAGRRGDDSFHRAWRPAVASGEDPHRYEKADGMNHPAYVPTDDELSAEELATAVDRYRPRAVPIAPAPQPAAPVVDFVVTFTTPTPETAKLLANTLRAGSPLPPTIDGANVRVKATSRWDAERLAGAIGIHDPGDGWTATIFSEQRKAST
jgi:hypothetical protein